MLSFASCVYYNNIMYIMQSRTAAFAYKDHTPSWDVVPTAESNVTLRFCESLLLGGTSSAPQAHTVYGTKLSMLYTYTKVSITIK